MNEILGSMSTEEAMYAGGFMGAILVLIGAFEILSGILYILRVIADWKIFKKAGVEGWKSIVPFYNIYVEYQLTWKSIMALPVILCGMAGGVLMEIGGENTGLLLLGSVLALVYFVLRVVGKNKLSKSFGHGTGFTVGLVLLEPVFYLMLGFGKSAYLGNTTENTTASQTNS
jgi:hypothetical protein